LDGDRKVESLVFSGHATRQMFALCITVDEVKSVVDAGEVIDAYPDDKPFPSELRLGLCSGRPLHVVLAYDDANRICYIITTYVPDPNLWSDDFKSRRKS